MKKKTAMELGVIAVMVVALVFASVSLVKRMGIERGRSVSHKPMAPAITATPARKSASSSGIKIRYMKDDKFYVKLSRVADVLPLDRDPFAFGGTGPRSSRDNLDLTGILWQDKKPTAIIDGSFYKVGDSTDEFQVVNILENKIILKDSAGEFELRLNT